MAVSTLSPSAESLDEVSLDEASALFERTGHPVRTRTLRRWCDKHGVEVIHRGRSNYASWSDLLIVHAKEVDAREAGDRSIS
jgi:hypothetical protein